VVRRIDLTELGIKKVTSIDIHDTTLVALDDTGKVSCLDIQSGRCTQQFQSGLPDPYRAMIRYNGREIIIAYSEQIIIRNAQTGELEQPIDGISQFGDPCKLTSTHNFILFVNHNSQVIAIPKRDPSARKTFEGEFETCIDANESHVALLTKTGEVQVFEDSPGKGLTLTQTYTTAPSPDADESSDESLPTLHIYRNWLCVKKDDTLYIWDLKTGIQLSKLRGLSDILSFRVNEQLLATYSQRTVVQYNILHLNGRFHTGMGPIYTTIDRQQFFSIYDFGRSVQLNEHSSDAPSIVRMGRMGRHDASHPGEADDGLADLINRVSRCCVIM
jgi:hypothetical protein